MVVEALYPVFDAVFSPIIGFPSHIAVLAISAFLTGIILVSNRLVVNKKILDEIKLRMEQIKENLNEAQKRGDKEGANKLGNEMLKTSNEYMRHTFKTLIVSLVVASLFLPWLGAKYQGLAVVSLPFSLPFVGYSLEWLGWYVLVSITLAWIANKLLGVS